MTLRAALRELLSDDDGYLSTGRAIALLGAALGAELVQAGIILAILEAAKITLTSLGLPCVGIGAGFFTGGALLKFGQKSQEARFVQPQISGALSSGDAHI